MLRLGLREKRTAFAPGDEIHGAAQWELEAAPKLATVRLCWLTRGKGSEDAAIVESVIFDTPQADDTRPFILHAPASPHSFSGTLISLIWVVELLIQPKDLFDRVEITIAPEGREISLRGAARKRRRER